MSTSGARYSTTRSWVARFSFCATAFIILVLSIACTRPAVSAAGQCNGLAYVHIDVFRLGFLGFGQRDGQHAVLVMGFHLLGRHRRRQRYRPLEPAKEAFRTIDLSVLELLFALALARDAQAAFMERQVNVFLLHAGQFHPHIEVVIVLE